MQLQAYAPDWEGHLCADDFAIPAKPVMTDYRAVALAEGFEDGDMDEQRAAWQHLHDTRLGYRLQGWFGRALAQLIEAGEIEP